MTPIRSQCIVGTIAILTRRPDLAGVLPPADVLAEATRWCA